MASKRSRPARSPRTVVRAQTGIRIERRILKVLKGIAEYHDLSVGDFLEGVLLHVFEGKQPLQRPTLQKIAELRRVYDLDLDASDSHRLHEMEARRGPAA